MTVNGHRENFEINSRGFRTLLAFQHYDTTGISLSGQTLDEVIRVIEGIALNRSPTYPTYRRVGEAAGRVYLDLGGPKWRAVEIDATGWRMVDRAPVKFLRSRGMLEIPEPEPGDCIESLSGFVNVETEADFRLLVAWLVATLRPIGPFPVLVTCGQQGSAKSTLARICRLLIGLQRFADPLGAARRARFDRVGLKLLVPRL